MSIQSALNQTLFSLQVGAGLYANSPMAQVHHLEKSAKKIDEMAERTEDAPLLVSEDVAQKGQDAYNKLSSLKPSQENIAALNEYSDAVETYQDIRNTEEERRQSATFKKRVELEKNALEDVLSRTLSKKEQKEAYIERKDYVKNKKEKSKGTFVFELAHRGGKS